MTISIFAALLHAEDAPKRYPPMIQKMSEQLAKQELNGEQRSKVDAILNDAATRIIKLRAQAGDNQDNFREEAGKVFADVRTKLQTVLSPEQMKQLQESMPKRFGPGGENPPPMMDGDKNKEQIVRKAPTSQPVEHLKLNEPAPDFKLKSTIGKPYSLLSFKGRPTVFLFGSFSSPTFRSRVDSFEELRKDYLGKVHVAIIYTREAYPNKDWDIGRNADDQVQVNQPTTIEDRIKLAKQTKDSAKMLMDVLVDDIDDSVTTAYDGFPNGCVVIDAAGNAVLKQRWADAWGIRSYLDSTLKAR